MRADIWLGLDVGTTGIRCVAFDSEFSVVGSHYQECPPLYLGKGIVEQDPEEWIRASTDVMGTVVAALPDVGMVRGLSLSTQSITVVPVDEHGDALRPAISWLDQRGEEMLPALAALMAPDEIRRRTGKPWRGAYGLPKVMWLQRHEPDVMRRCRLLMGTMDYVLFRLTGVAATDHTVAGGTMLYNNGLRDWDTDILHMVQLDRSVLPEILTAGSLAGGLLPHIASLCGLPGGLPVAVGAQDQKCAALAAGLSPGTTTISLGTAAAVEALQPSARTTEASTIASFSYLFDNTWVAEGVVPTAGAAVRWFSRTAAPTSSLAELGALAEAKEVTENGPLFLPFLSRIGVASDSQRWPADPSGVFWGLTLDADPGDLFRAVLEGITFECVLLLESMRTTETRSDERLRLFGGGSTSPVWCQLFADTTRLPVEVPATHEMAATGAAILAGMGASAWQDGFTAAERVPIARTFTPSPHRSHLLADKLIRYRELRTKIFD
ncbi:xylulokinase [Tessaracoccus sp.]